MNGEIIILTIHGTGETPEHVTVHTVKSAKEARLYIEGATVDTGEEGGRWVRCEIIEEWRKYPLCRKDTQLEDRFTREILGLDGWSMENLLQETEQTLLVKALKGMPPQTQNKIFQGMSTKAAAMLKEDMEYITPFRKSERNKAQEELLHRIERLKDKDRVPPPAAEAQALQTNGKIIIMTMHGESESADHVTIHRVQSASDAHLYVIAAAVETDEEGGPWVNCEIIDEWRKYPPCKKDTYMEARFIREVLSLDNRSMQKWLREIDSANLVKALKGMPPQAQDKIFCNMSKRAADMLKEEIEAMGPMRRTERGKALEKIVYQLERLVDEGIVIPVSDRA